MQPDAQDRVGKIPCTGSLGHRTCAVGGALTTMQPQSAVAPVTVTPAASHTRRWLKKTTGMKSAAAQCQPLSCRTWRLKLGRERCPAKTQPLHAQILQRLPVPTATAMLQGRKPRSVGHGPGGATGTPRFLPFGAVQLVDTALPAIFFEKSQSLVGRRPVRDQPACMLFLSFSYSQLVPQRSQT